MKIRTWSGKTSNIRDVKVIRDTGTGYICEDLRGIRYFAQVQDVITSDDLFAGFEK